MTAPHALAVYLCGVVLGAFVAGLAGPRHVSEGDLPSLVLLWPAWIVAGAVVLTLASPLLVYHLGAWIYRRRNP